MAASAEGYNLAVPGPNGNPEITAAIDDGEILPASWHVEGFRKRA